VVAYVDPTVTIEHLPYEKAYGAGFEDIRRRVPDLTRLREAIGFQARYGLDDILAEVITWKKASLDAGGSSLDSAPVRA
jgi:UDP-glucose 4-epimerase